MAKSKSQLEAGTLHCLFSTKTRSQKSKEITSCIVLLFYSLSASNIDKITSYNQKSIFFYCCNSDSSSVLLTTPILTFSLVVSTLLTPVMIPIVKR